MQCLAFATISHTTIPAAGGSPVGQKY